MISIAPNTFGNLRLVWQPASNATLEVEWANMGEYYTNPENTADYEGHDLLNLSQYQLRNDIAISLNISMLPINFMLKELTD